MAKGLVLLLLVPGSTAVPGRRPRLDVLAHTTDAELDTIDAPPFKKLGENEDEARAPCTWQPGASRGKGRQRPDLPIDPRAPRCQAAAGHQYD